MRVLLATNHLGLGGSETYLLTVAEGLERLGHEALVYTPEPGAGRSLAEQRGIPVLSEAELPADFDAAIVQDPGVSFRIAKLRPRAPQLFVAHSETFNLQAPPQLETAAVAVALNDRIAEHLGRHALKPEVVRLNQPIDTDRFVPAGSLPESPRSALLLSNTPHADRLAMIESACAAAGIELRRLGGEAGQLTDPRPAIAAADIVIGYGRSLLEGMACGKAAYVYDWSGGEGWVTAESYPRLEGDGFAGRSGGRVIDPDEMGDDLGRYRASMGPVNRDLVMSHHRLLKHAGELRALFERLEPPRLELPAPLEEMARLVRLEWRARVDARSLTDENAHLRRLLEDARREAAARTSALEGELERTGRLLRAIEGSSSWRLTRPLRALRARARRRSC
jgi:hypothetical protein